MRHVVQVLLAAADAFGFMNTAFGLKCKTEWVIGLAWEGCGSFHNRNAKGLSLIACEFLIELLTLRKLRDQKVSQKTHRQSHHTSCSSAQDRDLICVLYFQVSIL